MHYGAQPSRILSAKATALCVCARACVHACMHACVWHLPHHGGIFSRNEFSSAAILCLLVQAALDASQVYAQSSLGCEVVMVRQPMAEREERPREADNQTLLWREQSYTAVMYDREWVGVVSMIYGVTRTSTSTHSHAHSRKRACTHARTQAHTSGPGSIHIRSIPVSSRPRKNGKNGKNEGK